MQLLNDSQTADILNISKTTLTELVNCQLIPYTAIKTESGTDIKFNPYTINDWLKIKPNLKMDNKKYVERLKKRISEKYPESLKTLKEFDRKFSEPYVPKGYYLTKVNNKKLGFVYYVRYIKDGKLIPSRFCTHTNDKGAAERFAIINREQILDKYFERNAEKIKTKKELYSVLKKSYSENSPYLEIDVKRGRALGNDARKSYHNFITKQFIPYLRKNKIKNIDEIDTPFLARFQNYLLTDTNKKQGVKPQTINHYISYISKIFDHLLLEGQIRTNPCKSLVSLKIRRDDLQIAGCYEITKLKGVFNKTWKDEFSYLLCLIIYTTGMRNSEIERIKTKDIITIDNYHFIYIMESKTKNGVRIVPLHDFVHRKLSAFIRKNNKNADDCLFSLANKKNYGSDIYRNANSMLAEFTGYTDGQLQKENITFYSGRHFWKTLMNSESLGDIEEYFMGHKVSGDVAKRYNHRDKQGRRKLLEKTRKVFQILDKWIFNKPS